MSRYHSVTFAWGHISVTSDVIILPNWDESLDVVPPFSIVIWTEPEILELVEAQSNVCSTGLVLRSVALIELKGVLFEFFDIYCPPIGVFATPPCEWFVFPWPRNQLGNATPLFLFCNYLVKFGTPHWSQFYNVVGSLEHKFTYIYIPIRRTYDIKT